VKRPGIISNAVGSARGRPRQPLEIDLTVKFNFGDRPGDSVTLVDDRRVPLVGSVFENRDRIAREFLRLLLKAGAMQPAVMRRLFGLRGGRGE
jgi:hypothetical protein